MRYKNKNITKKSDFDTQHVLREGESIEEKLRRLTLTKEPMEVDFTPEIYQERKAGVDPACDIRTDKFEIAQAACDTMSRTYALARHNRDDFGKKKVEEFTYVTDTDGNVIKNPILDKK